MIRPRNPHSPGLAAPQGARPTAGPRNAPRGRAAQEPLTPRAPGAGASPPGRPAHDGDAREGAVRPTLSVREAADYLELGVTTVRRLIAEGQLEAYRLTARKVRVLRGSVTAYRKEQLEAPPYDDGIQAELRHARLKRGGAKGE